MYDVVVIGSGPAGYVCAIKAAQLGLKVAVVEKNEFFGGTCLNVGCIPSKALLYASEMLHEAFHSFDHLGIGLHEIALDLKKMMQHKCSVVEANVKGIGFLFNKNKIKTFYGTGSISKNKSVLLTDAEGKITEIATKNIVIATGSVSSGVPGIDIAIDEEIIVSSTGALSLSTVPKHMVVIGAGVIGLELGSVWKRLGSEVTVLEFQKKIIPGADNEISDSCLNIFAKQGIQFKLGAKVVNIEKKEKQALVSFQDIDSLRSETILADVVLVATGRLPFTDKLGLTEVGISIEKGRIKVNHSYCTDSPNIYAVGDVIDGPMLAHKAEDEGIAVAEIIAGKKGHVNYDVIPSVVYTSPEIAWIGKTTQKLESEAVPFKVGKFPFMANGRARASLHTEGFVKILADEKTDRVLGAHIIGHGAGEMIHEIAVLMEFGGASEDLARICHAHPTMSEAVRESALATFFKPIHI